MEKGKWKKENEEYMPHSFPIRQAIFPFSIFHFFKVTK